MSAECTGQSTVEFITHNNESTIDWFLPICHDSPGLAEMEQTQFSWAFRIERFGETLIITPESGYQHMREKELSSQLNRLLGLLESGVSGVVVDLCRTDHCPTDRLLVPTAALWNRLGKQPGRLALCGLCRHSQKVLAQTRLNEVWDVFATRHEALAHVI